MRTDLVLHFIVGFILSLGVSLYLSPAAGIIVAALAGIGRELLQDKRDMLDIIWTVLGGLLGAAMVAA